jgi:hypothetical protein
LGRPKSSRVGDRDGGAGKRFGPELALPSPTDDVVVGVDQADEVERVGVADDGDQQRVGAVALLDIDREAEPEVLVVDDAGPPGADVGHVRGVEHRHRAEGPDDGERDEMGEADLRGARRGTVRIDESPVRLKDRRGKRMDARSCRHAEARRHVLCEFRRRTA